MSSPLLHCRYTSWDHGYFKSHGIPGPKPKPFIGNTLDFLFEKGVSASSYLRLRCYYVSVSECWMFYAIPTSMVMATSFTGDFFYRFVLIIPLGHSGVC